MSKHIISGIGVALATIMAASAFAGVSNSPVANYDGTGSLYRPVAGKTDDHPKIAAVTPEQTAAWMVGLKKTAEAGGDRQKVNYASALEQGQGRILPDLPAALEIYKQAADHRYALAQQKMCTAYLLGEGVPVDLAKGMSYCNKLGEADPVGLFSAGYDYEHGVSGPVDKNTAMSFYAQAGDKGSGDAMAAIGREALASGKPELARAWFHRGVERGSAGAMDGLAALYETGIGGDTDAAEAYWLYANAARRGNIHAASWMAGLPSTTQPLNVVLVMGRNILVTRTIVDKSGTRTEPLDPSIIGNSSDEPVNGEAQIHCFINRDHEVDVCIVEREYPLGYDFGMHLEAFFNGKLSVAETDSDGQPTADTVFKLNYRWSKH